MGVSALSLTDGTRDMGAALGRARPTFLSILNWTLVSSSDFLQPDEDSGSVGRLAGHCSHVVLIWSEHTRVSA